MNVFEIGSCYNFNTLAPAFLGASYKNAKVLGILDYNIANSYLNVEITHKSIYPMLPVGTPVSSRSFTFILFEINGEKKVLATNWLDLDSVALVTAITIHIDVFNATSADVTKIRDTLVLSGYTAIAITTT